MKKSMKNIYTMAAGFLLCAGLASCEMKEELFGKGEVPSETGKVELGVAVNDKTNVVITKADATAGNDSQGSNVDPAEYPVIFTHQSADYTKECVYEDIDGTEVILPIGEYLVESHTPGELKKQMTYPYYGGEAKLTVTKDVTSEASVVCTMQNSRIVMTYGTDFFKKFSTWTININDDESVLTFTEAQGGNPVPVYWHFSENCTSIKINIEATTQAGESVKESRTITKPSGTGNDNWTGGDALTITMEPGPDEENPENPSGVSGITIKVEAFFPESSDKDDTVWVDIDGEETTDPEEPEEPENPGDGGEEEPEDPDTGSLSMTMPGNGRISYSISAGNAPSSADVVINAPEGISSLNVKMSSTNEDFNIVIDDLVSSGLDFKTNGVEVVGNSTMADILGVFAGGSVEIPALTAGQTSYTFPIASFFKLINAYGSGTYTFDIVLKDAANGEKKDTLTLTITD